MSYRAVNQSLRLQHVFSFKQRRHNLDGKVTAATLHLHNRAFQRITDRFVDGLGNVVFDSFEMDGHSRVIGDCITKEKACPKIVDRGCYRMACTPNSPVLSYTRNGDTGPKVILIMGFGMRGSAWKPQIDGLGSSCQLVSFDNRGVGESDAIDEDMSMLDIAKDASRVLDAIDWHSDVHVVGVSMGGMVAQELLLYQPERFASLSLIATHAGGKTSWLPPAKGIVRFLATQFSSDKNRPKTLARLLYPKPFLSSCNQDDLRARMKLQIGKPASRSTLRRQLRAIRNHDTRSRLPTISQPTLVVKPELDILVHPKHSDRLHRGLSQVSLLSIPDAGHGVTYQSASLLNERLLNHFQSAEP